MFNMECLKKISQRLQSLCKYMFLIKIFIFNVFMILFHNAGRRIPAVTLLVSVQTGEKSQGNNFLILIIIWLERTATTVFAGVSQKISGPHLSLLHVRRLKSSEVKKEGFLPWNLIETKLRSDQAREHIRVKMCHLED